MNEPIIYHCTLCDEPIIIQSSDRLLLALILMIEIKSNHWKFNEAGRLYAEKEEERITYLRLQEILELPEYTISRLIQDIKRAKNLEFCEGKNIKEKALCKLNRLVKIVFEMTNNNYREFIEEKLWDSDFEEKLALSAKQEGYEWEDYYQQRKFLKKHKDEFCRQYEIIGLAEWYHSVFPKCSRQTMKRDFDVLNQTGTILISYSKVENEYRVVNPWIGLN